MVLFFCFFLFAVAFIFVVVLGIEPRTLVCQAKVP